MSLYTPELAERILLLVSEGKTLRQISAELGLSMGTIMRMMLRPEHMEQYARARETASDIFENDIIEAAQCASPETAAADRVKIDALKWVAARRAPKRYGDRVQQEVTGPNGAPLVTSLTVNLVKPDAQRD